jgi:hypothetical protein
MFRHQDATLNHNIFRFLMTRPKKQGYRQSSRHWVPYPSPPMTHKAVGEIFKLDSTRGVQLKWSKVTVRQTDSRPVSLGVSHSSAVHNQIFITVGQLPVCWWWTPSLTRRWVYILRLLLALPEQPSSGPSPKRIITTFYSLIFEYSLTWSARSPYVYLPGIWSTSYTPATVFLGSLMVKPEMIQLTSCSSY